MDTPLPRGLEALIIPRAHDLGGFEVRRALPTRERQMVGPFIFFDQMGPGEFLTGQGLDVRPHPHIGLSTVTYLFEGEILHRDSLGTTQPIRPGAVNWMTAGQGITHSERSAAERRLAPQRIFGIQSWVALPADKEEISPDFMHHSAETLPVAREGASEARLIAGEAWGLRAPVVTASPLFYADLTLAPGAAWPLPDGHEERAAYVLKGEVAIAGQGFGPGQMLIFRARDSITLIAGPDGARALLLGGAAMDGPRHMFWNFVSSRRERIEQAKRDWQEGRFAKVPGDEAEFIPLP
ncbi:MAG: pirin family protein [Rubritepida sp.]|nr:pirin family protein [Rubritepida sp.]